MLVIADTANDKDTMRRLIRMGVDGIETDDPELGLRVRDNLTVQR
jgi:glycerophosphoryl diester phosphodiesterase